MLERAMGLVCLAMCACTRPAAPADEPANIPIRCMPRALTAEQRKRSEELRGRLTKTISAVEELPSGYSVRLTNDPEVLASAAEWIGLERLCCPFLTFDLRWTAGDSGPPRLALTGPEGTKGFLSAELPELAGQEEPKAVP